MRAALLAVLTASAASAPSSLRTVLPNIASVQPSPAPLTWSADGHEITATIAQAVSSVSLSASLSFARHRSFPHKLYFLCIYAALAPRLPSCPPNPRPRSNIARDADPFTQFLTSTTASTVSGILSPDSMEQVSTWADSIKDESAWKWSKVRATDPVHCVRALCGACASLPSAPLYVCVYICM